MKKAFFCSIVLLLMLTTALFAGRREIDDAYKSFEAVVLEAENLAKKSSISVTDFSAIAEKAEVAAAKLTAIENDKDLTEQDAQRFSDLAARYNKAFETITQKLSY